MITEKNWKQWAIQGSTSIILVAALAVSAYRHYVIEPRIEASKQELRESIQERKHIIEALKVEQFEIMVDALEATLNRPLTDEERNKLWQQDQETPVHHDTGIAL